MINLLLVGLGGACGSMLRYVLSVQLVFSQEGFPFHTLTVNVLGALLIGVLSALSLKHGLDYRLVLFLQMGVLGGFTTFSTFALETVNLLNGGKYGLAILYVLLSLVLSLGAVIIAHVLIK